MSRKASKRVRLVATFGSKKFSEWIAKFGIEQLAIACGVTAGAVTHWRNGRSEPNTSLVHAIIELSGGALVLTDIYNYPATPLAATQENMNGRRQRSQ